MNCKKANKRSSVTHHRVLMSHESSKAKMNSKNQGFQLQRNSVDSLDHCVSIDSS